ncbi:MAG: vancomycin high temperature exclusion protein [Flavobacteriales bacterium]
MNQEVNTDSKRRWIIPALVLIAGVFSLLNQQLSDGLWMIWWLVTGIALYRLVQVLGPKWGLRELHVPGRWKYGVVSLVIMIALVWSCDYVIRRSAEGRVYTHVDDIPHRHVGLLLGTSKYLGSGVNNRYYQYRIDAALKLWQSGKVNVFVISGDNSRQDYNEPETMRNDLIAAGVDSTRIALDYAGFRTLDSVVRVKEIFSQDSITVISQRFHNERAIYLAGKHGIDAIGFNARDVEVSSGLKTQLREKFARVKVFVDQLFGVEPKFLGPKVVIP